MRGEEHDKEEGMNGFKLLAIRPMKDCDKKFLKNLKEGMVYKFYQDYKYFVDDTTEITLENYELHSDKPISDVDFTEEDAYLYSSDDLKINTSAIVGKNGSGKSSLIELLFLICNLLSKKEEIYFPNLNKGSKSTYASASIVKDPSEKFKNDLISKWQKILDLRKKIKLELFYQKDDDNIVCLNFNGIKNDNRKQTNHKVITPFFEKFNLTEFFYSIAINYSLYGLNEVDSPWLKSLFHKNDGYKTPIVINPYRAKGNIDINSELHLAQTRTLLNLSSRKDDNPELVNNKRISRVKFTLDIDANKYIYLSAKEKIEVDDVINQHTELYGENVIDLFNKIAFQIKGSELNGDTRNELLKEMELSRVIKLSDKFKTTKSSSVRLIRVKHEMIKYAIRKLFKICLQYPIEYGQFIDLKLTTKPSLVFKDIKLLLEKIGSDKSHITLKLRQIVYSIFSDYLFEEDKWTKQKGENNKYEIEIDWKDLSNKITEYEKKFDKYLDERMEVVPAAFLKPELLIDNTDNEPHEYQGLSSGEQQLANVIQTVTYHLYNLNSVHYASDSASRLCYKNINIVFDEVELYFHPEFQRQFIDGLLKSIDQMNLKNTADKGVKAINIQFLTHSPFILSDIPSTNILRLKNGEPKLKSEQTFAANIHDLLANDFFLDKGFMGEFAKSKIEEVVDFLRMKKWEYDEKNISERIDAETKDDVKENLSIQLDIIKLQKKLVKNLNKSLSLNKCQEIIELVGEPVLSESLNQLLSEVKEINSEKI